MMLQKLISISEKKSIMEPLTTQSISEVFAYTIVRQIWSLCNNLRTNVTLILIGELSLN